MKWNEWAFRPPLCTYRLNWTRGTSWGWWNEWDDTALRKHDTKFEPWRSEVEHATSRSQRLPTILNLYGWEWKKRFVYLKFEGQSGVRNRDLRLCKQAALTTAPGSRPLFTFEKWISTILPSCWLMSRFIFSMFWKLVLNLLINVFSTLTTTFMPMMLKSTCPYQLWVPGFWIPLQPISFLGAHT